jgi:ELWxxDGT repeat protein
MKKSIIHTMLVFSTLIMTTGILSAQVLLKDLSPTYSGSPTGFTALNETKFVFAAYTIDDSGSAKGTELCISNGTAEGTHLLKDINKGGSLSDAFPPKIAQMIQYKNNLVLFEASDSEHGLELWKTDGTEEGTTMVKDIQPGGGRSYVDNFRKMNGLIYFTADTDTHGNELWVTDGTEEGTKMVKDINPGDGHGISKDLVLIDTVLYFQGNDGTTGYDLWRSNGTEEGTYMIKNMNGSENSSPHSFAKLGDYVYFGALDDAGFEVYRTSGEVGSVELVADINDGTGSSNPKEFTAWNNKLFFSASSGGHGNELYVYSQDSGLLHIDIQQGPGGSFPILFSPLNDKILFAANTSEYGLELWGSDGTAEGTTLVFDMRPGTENGIIKGISTFYTYGDSLYYSAVDGQNIAGTNFELWRSDGTTEGTMQLNEIFPGVNGSDPQNFFGFNGNLYFSAKDDVHGQELWTIKMTEITSAPLVILKKTSVSQPYPNPISNNTVVEISLEHDSDISYEISDVSGRIITSTNSKKYIAGHHQINIDMKNRQSGMYFLNVKLNNLKQSFKLIKN